MTDPLQNILQQAGLKPATFPPNSRYYGVGTAVLQQQNGEPIVYLQRRFIPPPERFALLQEHTVTEGERPDQIAFQYLGDPERFWQICDANAVMKPGELTEEIGKKLRITLPDGIPGSNNA